MRAKNTALPPGVESSYKSNYRFLFFCLIFCFSAVYFGTMTREGFWYDEVMTALSGRMSFTDMISERTSVGQLPLFFILSWGWQHLLGESEFTLRLWPIFFGLTSGVILFLIVENLSNTKAAFWAAFLLWVNPETINASQFARFYTLLLMLAMSLTYLTIIQKNKPSWRRTIVSWVMLTALLYTHYSAFFVYLSLMAFWLFRHIRYRRFLLAGVLALLCFLPYAAYSASITNPSKNLSLLSEPAILEGVVLLIKLSGTIQAFSRAEISQGMVFLPAVISFLTLFLTISGLTVSFNNGRILVFLIVIPVAAAWLMSIFNIANLAQITRYFITSVAAQAGLHAVWLLNENSAGKRFRQGALFFLVVMNICGLSSYFFNDTGCFYAMKAGWRETAKTITALKQPGERIYFSGSHIGYTTFNYYCSEKVIRLEARSNHQQRPISGKPQLKVDADILHGFGISPKTLGCWLYLSRGFDLFPEELLFIKALDRVMINKDHVPVRKGILLHYRR